MKKLNILIIDDDKGITDTFDIIKKIMKKKQDIDVKTTLANTKSELIDELNNKSTIYDIVFVDYFLEKTFGDEDGIKIIRKVRDINKLCKIIFFSTNFEVKKIQFQHSDYFHFINKLKIDGIVLKTEIQEIIEIIKETSDGINLFSSSLQKMIKDYDDISEKLYFKSSIGEKIDANELLKEIEKGTQIGKEFEKLYHKTLLNMILDTDF